MWQKLQSCKVQIISELFDLTTPQLCHLQLFNLPEQTPRELVKRHYRVRDNRHFQKIRRAGRSYSDRFVVLCILPNRLPYNRFGFSISKRIGKAVTRNLIKRRLREAMRLRMAEIEPGWDIVFIARQPIRKVGYHEMDAACARLLRRAHLLRDS